MMHTEDCEYKAEHESFVCSVYASDIMINTPCPPPGSLAWGVAGVGVEGLEKRSWGVPGPIGV